MRTFDVYHHPIRGHEVVKRGFSWPAFFFSGFWAMTKRMWGLGAGMLVADVGLWVVQEAASRGGEHAAEALACLLSLGVSVAFGYFGNGWRAAALVARGYEHLGGAAAPSADAALAEVARAAAPESAAAMRAAA